MIDDFIDRKHGRKKVEYDLPELKTILKETYGVIVYQEQVMQIANGWPATPWAKPTCCAAPWARRTPRRWPSSASASSSGARAARSIREEGREDFRPDGEVRRLRLQQVALRRLCPARLPDGLPEDALSRRVHGRVADLGHRQHRRGGQVHQRMPRNGHRRRTARHQRLRRQLHPAWRRHPLRPGGGEECRPQCHRIHRGRAQKTRPVHNPSSSSARRWICACSTSAYWSR